MSVPRRPILALAAAEPRRFHVLDATLPPAVLLQQAAVSLQAMLP